MKNKDIQPGFLVELKNGEKYLVNKVEESSLILVNPFEQKWLHLSEYDEDLKHIRFRSKDIMSVYGFVKDVRNYATIGFPYVDGRELLWKREKTTFEKVAQTKLKRLKTILDGRKRGNGPW